MSSPNRTPDKTKVRAALVRQEEHTIMTSGPIPDALALESYRRVRTDLPDLIIAEWLNEAAARRELAKREAAIAEREVALKERISGNVNRLEIFRLILGGTFLCGALLLAWWLASKDHPETALAIAALPVVGAIASAGIKLFRGK